MLYRIKNILGINKKIPISKDARDIRRLMMIKE